MTDLQIIRQALESAQRLIEDYCEDVEQKITQALKELARIDSPEPTAPHGWKLVPVEPTNSMTEAVELSCRIGMGLSHPIYHAMLSAAPSVSYDVVKDAERYRWLRNPQIDVAKVLDKVVGEMPYDEGTKTGGYAIYEYRAGHDLDEAIDDAMLAAAPNLETTK